MPCDVETQGRRAALFQLALRIEKNKNIVMVDNSKLSADYPLHFYYCIACKEEMIAVVTALIKSPERYCSFCWDLKANSWLE